MLTSSKIGNSALNLLHTVSWISSLLPGSCPANWLQGNASISRPDCMWLLVFKIFRSNRRIWKLSAPIEKEQGTYRFLCTYHTKHSVPCNWNLLIHYMKRKRIINDHICLRGLRKWRYKDIRTCLKIIFSQYATCNLNKI